MENPAAITAHSPVPARLTNNKNPNFWLNEDLPDVEEGQYNIIGDTGADLSLMSNWILS